MHNACFHCGLPLPRRVTYNTVVDGVDRAMCCAGCLAVAETIVAARATNYYRTREAMPARGEAVTNLPDELAAYDLPSVQNQFAHRSPDSTLQAALLLEGIRCAACVWLIERCLSRLPGILAVNVNYATRRLQVRWDPTLIKLSKILSTVAEVGYRATPFDRDKAEVSRRVERRQLLKELAMWDPLESTCRHASLSIL